MLRRNGSITSLALAVASVLTLAPMTALAESKALPTSAIELKNGEAPASDLLLNGQPLDADRAADLRKAGTDLSTLTPVANDIWRIWTLTGFIGLELKSDR